MSLLAALFATRKHRRRWHCLECDGFLFRRYQRTNLHRRCWIGIEAGINDG